MLAQAWRYADESIDERPAPADVGGFVVLVEDLHKIVANAGGAYLEYDTRGDQSYNPTGLLRVHIRGGNPVLGPSDGAAARTGGGHASLAVGPAWPDGQGGWRRLAEIASVRPRLRIEETAPQRVRFRVTYHGLQADSGPFSVDESYALEPDGVTVQDALSGAPAGGMRLYYPALVFDGESDTRVRLRRNTLTLDLRGRGMQFTVEEPRGATLQRNPERINHRNGQVEEVFAEVPGSRVVYRIAPR